MRFKQIQLKKRSKKPNINTRGKKNNYSNQSDEQTANTINQEMLFNNTT